MKNTKVTTVNQNTTALSLNVDAFFGNIDFSKLNATIANLANHNTTLSKTEKKSAIEIINSWNSNVIDKLNIEKHKIEKFINCIQHKSGMGISDLIVQQEFITELEAIISLIKMDDKYEELMNTMDEYTLAESALKSIDYTVVDTNTTKEEEVIMRKDCELARITANAQVIRVGNKIAKLNNELTTTINSNPDMQKLIRTLKRKAVAMDKLRTECTDKAQLAKINVTIDDSNIRDTLSDLINFSF